MTSIDQLGGYTLNLGADTLMGGPGRVAPPILAIGSFLATSKTEKVTFQSILRGPFCKILD